MHRKDTRCAVSFVVRRLVHECQEERAKENEREEEVAEGRAPKERERGNESRAWPINHTFVGITLLYTLAFARSKGSPRAPFSPATRTRLSLSFALSFLLSPLPRFPYLSLCRTRAGLSSDT